jgi:membrane fusion protein (multidrug efflux system)
MNNLKKLKIFYLSIFLLPMLITLSSCGSEETPEEEKSVPFVKVRGLESEEFTETYSVVGVVKPYEEATLSSEQGGLITYLGVDKGSRVGRGQVVIRIKKDVEYASYEQSIAQYEFAQSEYERLQRLYESGVATEQQFTNAKYNLEIAEKTMDVAETRLSASVVRSPISGVVDAKMMNKGEMSSPGSPIVRVVNVTRVKVSVGIPERYVNDITKGTTVKLTFDVFPGESFSGIVDYVSPTISSTNRTFEIEVVIDNPQGKLKPEMSVNVSVTRNRVSNAIILDQGQIVDYGEEKYVYIEENGIARKRVITLGGTNGNYVHVTSGLNPGDKLIYEGYQALADGDEIKVIQ